MKFLNLEKNIRFKLEKVIDFQETALRLFCLDYISFRRRCTTSTSKSKTGKR